MRLSFTEHPASVGETYFQHLRSAVGFSGHLLSGGVAYLINAVFPSLLKTTGDEKVVLLYDRMVINRKNQVALRRARKAEAKKPISTK